MNLNEAFRQIGTTSSTTGGWYSVNNNGIEYRTYADSKKDITYGTSWELGADTFYDPFGWRWGNPIIKEVATGGFSVDAYDDDIDVEVIKYLAEFKVNEN